MFHFAFAQEFSLRVLSQHGCTALNKLSKSVDFKTVLEWYTLTGVPLKVVQINESLHNDRCLICPLNDRQE